MTGRGLFSLNRKRMCCDLKEQCFSFQFHTISLKSSFSSLPISNHPQSTELEIQIQGCKPKPHSLHTGVQCSWYRSTQYVLFIYLFRTQHGSSRTLSGCSVYTWDYSYSRRATEINSVTVNSRLHSQQRGLGQVKSANAPHGRSKNNRKTTRF